MKTRIVFCLLVLVATTFAGNAMAGSEVDDNTRYGLNSGANITTGHDNSFFGNVAGHENTTGCRNTFVGGFAGYKNTTGWYNTFIGTSAGCENTTGGHNTFLGYYAGSENTTGQHNTFIGSEAGYKNTTAYYNTFIGSEAGYKNTTGGYNTFIGRSAGYSNTTGNFNTFIGREAGYKNTEGINNTLLGYAAGHENQTGSGNVFIGHYAGFYETGSNKLYISNSDTATPLIKGDFSTGTVVINGKITLQSSREVKDEIEPLTVQEATDALEGLRPVTFVYKADREERHAGFIAEDLPEPVATKDRKGVNPMDIVTVLTKVVQEQQGIIAAHSEKIAKLERLLAAKGN